MKRLRIHYITAFCFCSLVSGVNYVYDETIWTKSLWQEQWKVENPLQFLNPTSESPKNQMAGISSTLANSMDGPNLRRDLSKVDWEVVGISDEAQQDPRLVQLAADAILCQTCHVLLSKAWQKAVMSLLRGSETDAEATRAYMEQACENEVIMGTLAKNAIYKMETDDGSATLMSYVVRDRKSGDPPAIVEKQAVRHACEALVKSSGTSLAQILQDHLRSYRQTLEGVLRKHNLLGSDSFKEGGPDTGDSQINEANVQDMPVGMKGAGAHGASPEYLQKLVKKLFEGLEVDLKTDGNQITVQLAVPDEGDDDLADDDPCMDVHPKCRQWADAGECEANPKYMVGDQYQMGSCRKSCGVCIPQSREEFESQKPVILANPALSKELETVSTNLLQALKNHGCGSSKACLTGASGSRSGPGFTIKQNVPAGSGFVLGKPSYGIPYVTKAPEAPEGISSKAAAGRSSSRKLSEIDQVLIPELEGKLLRIPAEFFIYEYMYKNHTRHFHEDEKTGEITEDWLLGIFERGNSVAYSAATGEAANLNILDFIPEMRDSMAKQSWPFVKQVYSRGQVCTLGGGKRVVRRTEVRIACSPDKKLRLLVREPDFCRYIFVIYSPGLCQVEQYSPKDVPTPISNEM